MTGANQPPPLEGYNLFRSDRALVETLEREGAGWEEEQVSKVGELVGGQPLAWGFQANAHPPVLRSHDRFGERIDEVDFHPAWHAMMRFMEMVGHARLECLIASAALMRQAGAGHAPRGASGNLRTIAPGASVHAERAGGSRHRIGGGDGRGAAPGESLRPADA